VKRAGLWGAIAVGVVSLLFVAVLATRDAALTREAQSPLLGKPAPGIAGASVVNNQQVDLAQLRGRFVLINFVASWCVPCAQEHPELVTFSQRHQSANDVSVVGVIFDDTTDNVRRFFGQRGGDWPVVADPDGHVALDYGVRGPPESFLIDTNGFIVSKIIGRVTADGLDQLIRRAKAGA
jgi:cytochrome c biogenesis protein CcmG, thiol:disulfide interchange protein DsbE